MGKVTCEACKKKCKKEAVRLQDKFYHVSCFACKECQKPLAMDGFYSKDGAHYCADDYHRLFVSQCRICGERAEGNVVSVLGYTYHQQCFHCSKCGRKFEPGDKVTFSTKDHWCKTCTAEADRTKSPSSPDSKKPTALLSASPPKPPRANDTTDSEGLGMTPSTDKSGYGSSNGMSPEVAQMASLTSTCNESEIFSSQSPETSAARSSSVKSTSSQPPRFGTPDNRFYNMSYLSCTSQLDYKRGPSNNPVPKDPIPRHFHRPDNFSYTSVKRDFVKPVKQHAEKQETGNEKAIERDDWPGPPEPAVAYPELFREKVFTRKSESGADTMDGGVTAAKSPAEEQKITKEITELTKMTDSGAAAMVLRDLKKKRSESPTLDPRNASRTPSAAMEPSHKPRYETPYFASPSRDLEMLKRRSRSTENRTRSTPPSRNGLVAPLPGYGLKCITPDILHTYNMDGVDGEPLPRRPQSSAAYVHLRSSSPDRKTPTEEIDYDPTTGLRHSSHLKSLTLPPGLSSHAFFDNVHLAAGSLRIEEPPKIYAYEELKSEAAKQLPGVDHHSLERHLSPDEFELLFKMTRSEFYRLPEWKRNDEKMRVGLWRSDEKGRASVAGVV